MDILYSHDTEQAALLSCITSDTALDIVMETCEEQDFHVPSHKMIFSSIKKLYHSGRNIDRTTILNELKSTAVVKTLSQLLALTEISPKNIEDYCAILHDKTKLRIASQVSDLINKEIRVGELEPSDILDQAQNLIFKAYSRESEDDAALLADIFDNAVDIVKSKMYNKDTNVIGIKTNINRFDRMFYGFEDQQVTVIAGRPSMGKTEFAIQCAVEAALQGITVLILSLEQPRQELIERIISNVTGISSYKIRTGFLGKQEVLTLEANMDKIRNLPIIIDDTPSLTLTKYTAKLRKAKRIHSNLKMVVIDYIQLMDFPSKDTNKELGLVSKGIRNLGRSLGVSTILISQLNRDCDKRENKRPLLSDLRDSGSLEQDADKIVFLYSDYPYTKKDEDLFKGEIILSKHRNGPVGIVLVTNNKITQRFYDAEELSPEHVQYSTAIEFTGNQENKEDDDLPF